MTTIFRTRTLVAAMLVAVLFWVTAAIGPAGAATSTFTVQAVDSGPVPAGTVVPLGEFLVPSGDCTITYTAVNNSSVWEGNNIRGRSGPHTFVLPGVEDAPGIVVTATTPLVGQVALELVVGQNFGTGGKFSIEGMVVVDCQPATTTTTTTSPTTSSPSTTTSGPPVTTIPPDTPPSAPPAVPLPCNQAGAADCDFTG